MYYVINYANYAILNDQNSQTWFCWQTFQITRLSLNFSQFGPGAADLELKMHVQLTYFFFLSTNGDNLKFGGIQEFFLGSNFTTA